MVKSFKFGRALVAGLWGTVAMTALMYGWPLLGLPGMDIMTALGSVFPFHVSPYLMGALVHVGIGVSLGLVYALLFDWWLPGPSWLGGALFSFIPWIFAIILLGPTLQIANELFKGREAVAANPCAVANPCGTGPRASSNGISPEAISLMVHLVYGLVLGIAYRPSDA